MNASIDFITCKTSGVKYLHFLQVGILKDTQTLKTLKNILDVINCLVQCSIFRHTNVNALVMGYWSILKCRRLFSCTLKNYKGLTIIGLYLLSIWQDMGWNYHLYFSKQNRGKRKVNCLFNFSVFLARLHLCKLAYIEFWMSGGWACVKNIFVTFFSAIINQSH